MPIQVLSHLPRSLKFELALSTAISISQISISNKSQRYKQNNKLLLRSSSEFRLLDVSFPMMLLYDDIKYPRKCFYINVDYYQVYWHYMYIGHSEKKRG
jgi:hypothetical protein